MLNWRRVVFSCCGRVDDDDRCCCFWKDDNDGSDVDGVDVFGKNSVRVMTQSPMDFYLLQCVGCFLIC